MQNGILRPIFKIHISFFEPYRPNLTSKLAKSANKILQMFLGKHFIWVSSNAKFDASLNPLKKCQQINPKSYWPKTFAHSDESKKHF
jgi:hypothetical protein